MTKQEKVISGLQHCTMCVAAQCDGCPYQPQHTSCQRVELMRDALELIQTLAQIPVINCSAWHKSLGQPMCFATPERLSCSCEGDKRCCNFFNWMS